MKKSKIVTTFLVIALSVGFIHAARFVFGPKGKVTFDKRILNRSKGNPNAPVWIVEYMDYQCPACRTAFYVIDAALKEYPSQIYFQVRFHPLKQHPHGLESAVYSECAMRQKKFWEFHRLLFENQKEWEDLILTEDKFHEYAQRAGLNSEALDACLADPLTSETVLKENTDSRMLGVNTTPTFFVNGKMIVGIMEMKAELQKLFPNLILKDKSDGGTSH